ncbi:fibrinogen C domain-containing protein 1-like [Mytilus trossulus]|uniref:fibrinogen C domain-containing protein 1-like n=1 Tax=Mytilus trossulus TaxID=6551 RepID=UPI0030074778
MEFIVVLILSSLICICNGNVFGPSTQNSVEADKRETRYIQSDINVLKDNMHELLKRVIENENDISSLKSENQYLTNKLENERRHFSCEINELHENTNEQQQDLTDTNTEIIHLNQTIEELRNGVDKLEELQRRRSEDTITECIDKPESNQERNNRDCTDIQNNSNQALESGVYNIYPNGTKSVQAYCDMSTDGGGWTVIQKRFDGSVDFNQNWVECEKGFGNITGEFWFGNNYAHTLTASRKYELRIDMVDTSNNTKYAVYKRFSIGDAASKYRLFVGDYAGNAVDSLKYHDRHRFSAKDQNNDFRGSSNCASHHLGPWWYNFRCYSANLNLPFGKMDWSDTGHKQDKCQNDWVCSECGKEGHKAKECITPSKAASDNETPDKAASDSEANKTVDQSDSSESESGEETDIGDHVDHSETPLSQSILLPTEAITATTTASVKSSQKLILIYRRKKTRKKKNKDKAKNKPKVESKGPIDKFIVNPESTTPVQKQGKRLATTPTDEYHNRQTDSSKSLKT